MNFCFECGEEAERIYPVVVLNKVYRKPSIVKLPLCEHCAENSEHYGVCCFCDKIYSVEELEGVSPADVETCPSCLLKNWKQQKKTAEKLLAQVENKLRTFFD